MKGISTNPELVTVWVNSFSMCSHLDNAVGDVLKGQMIREPHVVKQTQHQQENEKIADALDKCTHSLSEHHAGVYNICNGLVVAPDTVNVQDVLAIGMEQSEQFSASLSSDFHKPIQTWVKTMEVLK